MTGIRPGPQAASGASSTVPGRMLWPTAAWFWGLQFSILNPLLAVLLVALYGATAGQVGVILGAYNVGGFIASFVIPAIADRTRNYVRPLLFSAICGIAMVAVLTLTSSLPVAVVALVLLGGPPGVGSTLLFAQLRHEGADAARVVRTRAIVSFAWVLGPPLATAVTGAFSTRAALVLLGLVACVNVATSILLLRRHRGQPAGASEPRPPLLAQLRGWGKLGLVIAFVLLQATNAATVTVTGLFVTQELHAPLIWSGIALAAAALLEIPALLLIARLLLTLRGSGLLLIGCVIGALYYALAAFVDAPWQFILIQPLNAWFFSTVAGVGLTLFQDAFASPGLASGLFTNTRRVAAVLSGVLISAVAVFPNSYRALYLASGGMVAVVLLGLGWVAVARRASGRTMQRDIRSI